ncbi:zinc finger CCCH domain-containing protein 63-like [Alnus glutinosa]|uniref:zinc finger CCCH domain-containing protein 63-like n=1 Tax=Alnus glutinosa TaxID=3517 RepID=UPI002D7715B8|nr:zinc finger CCCH domain-containing protein 63-like [Alnus glutinosa]
MVNASGARVGSFTVHSEIPVLCTKKGSFMESCNQQDLLTKKSNYIRTKNKLVLKRSSETTVEKSREDAGSKDCKKEISKNLALKNERSGSNSTEDVLKKSEDVGKQNVCESWAHGNCMDGDKCQSLHSWFNVDGLTILARLQGHTKVWDLKTLVCVMTLDGHADTMTSLICWDQYLLSGSLDHTIKVWAMREGGNVEVIHTHNEEHGVVAFCGMASGNGKPTLYCSCNNNSEPSMTRELFFFL